jgi:nucleoside-diphosphate-sugar epimerase
VKALVTGAAGFVGRHMVRALCSRGWEVDGVDVREHDGDPTTDGGWYCHGVIDALDVFRSDDWPMLTPGPYDLVVHAAAAEPHRAAIDGKPMLLAKNLQLDAAMFDWAVRTGTRVLYLSSSAAYPVGYQAGNMPYRLHEDDADPDTPVTSGLLEALGLMGPLRPDANYGWAKLTGERLAAAASESGLPVHVVRPFSGCGEDQSLDFPFPSIVARARTGDLSVWGPPGQTRDWIHIDDLVAGALAVVDADERRPVNLCTGVGTEMGDLARLVAKLAGVSGEVQYQPDRPTGVMYRVGDPARMNEHYVAKVSIEEGVRRALGAS